MFPPNRGVAALAMLASFAVGAAAEPATITTKVNLRAGPGGAFAVVAVMPEGASLDVQKCGDEWCRVRFGSVSGYAHRAFLKPGEEVYAAASPKPAATPAEPKPTLTGPTIWEWNDREQRDRIWRDIQFHNRMR